MCRTRTGGISLPDHKFTGQKQDGSGLYYYNARYYDPHLGTFLSPDTLVPDPTELIDYNRYSYARGNPLKYNDPSGHCVFGIDTIVCVAAVAIGAAFFLQGDDTNHVPTETERFSQQVGAAMMGIGGAGLLGYEIFGYGAAETARKTAQAACSDGNCTNEAEAVAGSSSRIVNFAQSLQGSGNYPGVDKYTETIVKKGTILYSGAPGQSNFYTTEETVKAAGSSAQKFFQGLQVGPHPQFGYRPGVTAYEVLTDIPVAIGKALANPQHGVGGSTQIVIENFKEVLQPLYSIPFAK